MHADDFPHPIRGRKFDIHIDTAPDERGGEILFVIGSDHYDWHVPELTGNDLLSFRNHNASFGK